MNGRTLRTGTCLSLVLASAGVAPRSTRADLGGFAPSGVTGSADDVPDAFHARPPVNRTANLRGPIPSNRWWSAVLVGDEVKNLSAFPLFYASTVREFPAEGD